jgi:hypothetical protein
MWLTKIFTAVLAILTGLLPSSCSKTKNPTAQHPALVAAQKQAPTNAPAVDIVTSAEPSTHRNLGELELTNHYETCVDLGVGKSITIKPTQLDHSNLKLTMMLESRNTTGGTEDLNVVQVVAKTGKPFEIAVGDMNLTLTPELQDDQ